AGSYKKERMRRARIRAFSCVSGHRTHGAGAGCFMRFRLQRACLFPLTYGTIVIKRRAYTGGHMEKQTRLNQSVPKTLQIIGPMAQAREPLRLADLAQQVHMPASTTLRMVNTLVERHYAYQDPVTLRYALTLRFAQIGAMVSDRFSIRDT